MPYCTREDVEFYGQFSSSDFTTGYSYNESIQKAIDDADRKIDGYCNVPEGFFTAGGVEIHDEHLNGADVVYLGGITKFFNWFYGGTSHLKFRYGSASPGREKVLDVDKLEEETSAGTWTLRTEGTGNDYIVVDDGVRFVQNTPAWKYKNVRATYRVGYTTTPWQVSQVSARLAAAILQDIQDRKTRDKASVGPLSVSSPAPKEVFTQEMKADLESYRRIIYSFA